MPAYVAVSGTPGRGSVHVVNQVPSLGNTRVRVVNGVRSTFIPSNGVRTVVQNVHPQVLQPVNPVVVVPARKTVPVRPIIQTVPLPRRRPQSLFPTDRLPLPKCSFLNTDFPGDDIILEGERSGINAGSARACKARCRLEDRCNFWSYKEGSNRDTTVRDCFLKVGTPGLPVPREAVPRVGFVSGTRDNNCVCIKSEDEEDENQRWHGQNC